MTHVDSSTIYSLISLSSGLCLGSRAEAESAFAKLTMQEWQGLPGQRWGFEPQGEQDLLLRSPEHGACVEMLDSSPHLLDISARDGASPWHLIPAEQQSFIYLYNPKNRRCAAPFEEGHGSMVHGQLLSNLPSQKWLLQPVEVRIEAAQGFQLHLVDAAACREPLRIQVGPDTPSLLLRVLPAREGRGVDQQDREIGFELRRPDGALLGVESAHPKMRTTSTEHGLRSCIVADPEEGEWQVRFLRSEGVFSFAAMVDASGDKEGIAEEAFGKLSEPTRRHMRSILAAETLARTTTAADQDGPNLEANLDDCLVCRSKWILIADLMSEHSEELMGDGLLLDQIAKLFDLDHDQALQYSLILATTRRRLWAQRWCQLLGRCP